MALLRIRRAPLVTVVLLVLSLGACTDSDKPSASTTTTGPEAPATSPMTLTADDDGFQLDVDSVEPGWVAVTVRNDTKAPLDIAIVHLRDGSTADDLASDIADDGLSALLPAPAGDGHETRGGVTMVPPGTEKTFRTEVFSGQNAIGSVSQMIDGGGPDPARFDVSAGDLPFNDPTTDGHVQVYDFSFAFDAAMRTPGRHDVIVTAEANQVHEMRLYRVKDGIDIGTALDALQHATTAPNEPTDEVEPVVGVGPIAPPTHEVVDVELEEGSYVAVCFLTDPASGKRFSELGMVEQLIVAP
jgi:hypothetical protein